MDPAPGGPYAPDMISLRSSFVFAVLALSVLAAGCGSKGEVGESCDTRGSVDECVDGAICSQQSDAASACLKTCTDDAQCGADEACNGVEGSSTKACRPKSK